MLNTCGFDTGLAAIDETSQKPVPGSWPGPAPYVPRSRNESMRGASGSKGVLCRSVRLGIDGTGLDFAFHLAGLLVLPKKHQWRECLWNFGDVMPCLLAMCLKSLKEIRYQPRKMLRQETMLPVLRSCYLRGLACSDPPSVSLDWVATVMYRDLWGLPSCLVSIYYWPRTK